MFEASWGDEKKLNVNNFGPFSVQYKRRRCISPEKSVWHRHWKCICCFLEWHVSLIDCESNGMESHIYEIGHTCCDLVLLLLGQCAAVSSFAGISFVLCVSFGRFFCCAVPTVAEPIAVTRFMLSIRIVSRDVCVCWSINGHFKFNQSLLFEGKNKRLFFSVWIETSKKNERIGRQQVVSINNNPYSSRFFFSSLLPSLTSLIAQCTALIKLWFEQLIQ